MLSVVNCKMPMHLERLGCYIACQKLNNINYMQATAMRVFYHKQQKSPAESDSTLGPSVATTRSSTTSPLASPALTLKATSSSSSDRQVNEQQQPQQQQQQQPQQQKSVENPAESSTIMGYNIDWIFPRMRHPSNIWYIASSIAVLAVGLFSKIVLVFMNRTVVHNRERLVKVVAKRPAGVPLVTVSNHHSCFDDPGLWGVLPIRYVCNTFKIRWSMAANDICFTNKLHSLFFMFGKCIPVVRGIGVYQDAVNLCIQKCSLGHWVHVFPEGKVNMTKEEMRLKWGVGRIIYESPRIPIVLPMWHEGMDEVLPNVEPYILKWRKKVTLNIGEPIDLNDFVQDLKDRQVPEPEARKLITDKIQNVFHDLRLETESLHRKRK